MPTRSRLSLKARALGWLAQREHSRAELRRKLLRVARQEAAQRQAESASVEPQRAATAEPRTQRPTPPLAHGDDRLPAPVARAASDAGRMSFGRRSPLVAGTVMTALASATVADSAADCTDPEACVDRLLDWLQAHRYLSEARFVESRVHARAARYGNLRIRQELAQHGVAVDEATLRQLRDSEFERAREVWRRKFEQPPADAHERARQMRFLAQRGFSAEVVRRVVQGADDE